MQTKRQRPTLLAAAHGSADKVLVCTMCGNRKTIINAEDLTDGQHDTTCLAKCGGKVTAHRPPNVRMSEPRANDH